MKNLVTADWLNTQLDDPDLVVIDCTNGAYFDDASGRWRSKSGIPDWQQARIPGSRHADITRGLSGHDARFRNTLPHPSDFIRALSELGVGPGRRVVLYDTENSAWAARMWWMLRWVGFDDAWLLDGGLAAWRSAGYPVESGPASPLALEPAALLEIKMNAGCFVTSKEVVAVLDDNETVLIDALDREQFSGQQSQLGLSGHIPGAVNVPAAELIDPQTKCYLQAEALRKRLPEISERPVIAYCGSGVSAASNAFALAQLGFEQVSIYLPGLQEWRTLEGAPVEFG